MFKCMHTLILIPSTTKVLNISIIPKHSLCPFGDFVFILFCGKNTQSEIYPLKFLSAWHCVTIGTLLYSRSLELIHFA